MRYGGVKILLTLLLFFCAISQQVQAHPGNTASDGCHYCRTNCSSWGYTYGVRHCHGGGFSTPSVTPTYTTPTFTIPTYDTTPSCPLNAYYDYSGDSCVCNYGYTVSNNKCISLDQHCRDKYGFSASYNSLDDSCECSYGYIMAKDIFGDTKCTDGDRVCRDDHGIFAEYNSSENACECSSGYVFEKQKFSGDLKCVSCTSKHGRHAEYNRLNESCECKDGYTLDEDNQCVEKQNNVYFYLKELDEENEKIVIQSNYDYRSYLVEYGLGCYLIQFYVGQNIVVNLGTDFSVDFLDKIVLQDHDDTCTIIGVEEVDSDFTIENESEKTNYFTPSSLQTSLIRATEKSPTERCQAAYGANSYSDGTKNDSGRYMCSCNDGYLFNEGGTKCVALSEACREINGINSYSDGAGGCLCKDGYIYDDNLKQCVVLPETSPAEKCQATYGINSYPDGTGGCLCKNGYTHDFDNNGQCTKKISGTKEISNEFECGSTSQCQQVFDIDASKSQFKSSILSLKSRSVVNGYSDGTFKPFSSINRAEFIKIVVGAKFKGDSILEQCTDGGFSDIPDGAWYENYACVAKGFGIADGYSDGTFRPEQQVNVAEALKITLKAFGIETRAANSSEAWYVPFTEYARNNGYYLNTFDSNNKQLTREDMAELVYRMMPSE